MKEDDNVLDFLMSQPNVMPRLNDRVLSTNSRYIDLTGTVEGGVTDLSSLSTNKLTAVLADSISYLTSKNRALTPITAWIVADATQKSSRELLLSALEHVGTSRLVRLGLLHNVDDKVSEPAKNYIDAIDAALAKNDMKLLGKLLKEANAEAIISGKKTAADFDVEPAQKSSHGLKLHRLVAQRVLQFQPGQRGLVVNGRVLGNLNYELLIK